MLHFKFLFCILGLFITSIVNSQELKPLPDSCLFEYRLLSNENIPYPYKTIILTNLETNNSKQGITDSVGCLNLLLGKGTQYDISVYSGFEKVNTNTIKTPSNEGLFSLKYESKIDIFEEDKENEVFITDQFSNTTSLHPSDSLALIKVSLKDTNNLAIAAKTILFRNPISKEVYVGQTNNKGTFDILLPMGIDYGVRLNQNGNRIPANNISTKIFNGLYTLEYNIVFSFNEKYTFREENKNQDLNNITHSLLQNELPEHFILENIYFDFDKATLRHLSYVELEQLAFRLMKNENIIIEIEGHTDDFGDDVYNIELSEHRAQAVLNHLIEIGIAPERMTAVGYGESKPISSNKTESGRQLNRRTAIKVIKQ